MGKLTEAVVEAMQERLDREPERMRVRRETVEHPYGTIKSWMGSTHFLTRGLSQFPLMPEISFALVIQSRLEVKSDPLKICVKRHHRENVGRIRVITQSGSKGELSRLSVHG